MKYEATCSDILKGLSSIKDGLSNNIVASLSCKESNFGEKTMISYRECSRKMKGVTGLMR